jgi:hypothetical protein
MGVEGFPVLEAVASRGDGVFDTLKSVVKLTLGRLRTQFEAEATGVRAEAPPPPPPPPARVFAPSALPASPEPPVVDASPPAVEEEHPDEFDLEEYQPEATTPAPEAGSGEPSAVPDLGGAVPVDRAREFEMFTAGGDEEGPGFGLETLGESGAPAGGEGAPFWAAQLGGEAAAAGPAEPPAWALAMQEELRSLREENRGLRSALRGLAGAIERQIAALEAGREEVRRAAEAAEEGKGRE